MNSVSLLTGLFLSPWVGITLLSELSNPVLSRSQQRDQLHGARALRLCAEAEAQAFIRAAKGTT